MIYHGRSPIEWVPSETTYIRRIAPFDGLDAMETAIDGPNDVASRRTGSPPHHRSKVRRQLLDIAAQCSMRQVRGLPGTSIALKPSTSCRVSDLGSGYFFG